MIPKSFVQELLGRVDIADVIEAYVPLKRAGSNLVACCPFHTEKSPSFTVSPTKQFYHCFGCGAHGSVIGFLMEHSGMSFVEAVKELAGRVGLAVPENRSSAAGASPPDRIDELLEVMHRAAAFYKAELKKSERAIAYLRNRGLTGEIAARFGLGYAPNHWQSLAAVFEDYGSGVLTDAGLVISNEAGKRYDRFRDRIMYPIINQRGYVIGFGGRVLDKSEPKYLNSPETVLFEKGHELYGLFQARQAIRAAGRVLVVEGYMDVVALAQFGIANAVATLGTATTPAQVHKLFRYTEEVVFCFDGDAAGRRAAWRALENSLEQLQDGKQVKFLFLPPEHDPDSFLRAEGKDRFEQLLTEAVPLSTFMLRQLTERADLGTAEGVAKFLQDLRPLVKRMSAPILALVVRKRAAELTGLLPNEVDQRLGFTDSPRAAPPPPAARRRCSDPYSRLLERALAEPALLRDLAHAALPSPETHTAGSRALFQLLDQCLQLQEDPTLASVLELLRQTEAEQLVGELMPAVQDLQKLSKAELAVEVAGLVEHLRRRSLQADAARTLASVRSMGELSGPTRESVLRALSGAKPVKGN